jgi:PIN domain nuclease of toxin-antitoxin system
VRLRRDTQVVLQWLTDETLSEKVGQSIATEAGALMNAASVWEIAIT